MEQPQPSIYPGSFPTKPLKFLNSSHIEMIDESLAALGDFGEVRLVVEKGRLRFVVTQCSHDALKWQPGRPWRKD